MTIKLLKTIFEKCDVPDDVTLLSDSNWECDETNMDGVYYNHEKKIIIFTQSNYSKYDKNPDFELFFCRRWNGEIYKKWENKNVQD